MQLLWNSLSPLKRFTKENCTFIKLWLFPPKLFRSSQKLSTKKLSLREKLRGIIRDLIILWAFLHSLSASYWERTKGIALASGWWIENCFNGKTFTTPSREIFYKLWNIFISLRAIAIFDHKIFIVAILMVFGVETINGITRGLKQNPNFNEENNLQLRIVWWKRM